MELPEKIEGVEVNKALLSLRKQNKKDLEFRRKKGIDKSNGGYFGFLYSGNRRDNLVKALTSGNAEWRTARGGAGGGGARGGS